MAYLAFGVVGVANLPPMGSPLRGDTMAYLAFGVVGVANMAPIVVSP